MRFLRPLESLMRMLQCLFGMLMSGLVIFFAVVRRSNAVCMCGEFVEFGSSLMRVIWHSGSHPRCPVHLKTIPFFRLPNNEQSHCSHPLLIRRQKRANGNGNQNKWERHRWREKIRNDTLSPRSRLVSVPKWTDEGQRISY